MVVIKILFIFVYYYQWFIKKIVMIIEINTDFLKEHSLSADDYLYLYIIQKNGYEYLQTLTLNPDIDTMLKKGYLELSEDRYIVTETYRSLYTSDFDSMFTELLDTYPMKVQSNRGNVRILHAKDPRAKANNKSKNKYKKITKSKKAIHEHIIKCLNIQLKTDDLSYMQNLETWLNNHTWEKYEDISYENKSTDSQRITRQL